MSSCKVSVVIPAFNVGKSIARSLDSVLAQTLAPAEVIIVDDGSSDDTCAVVSEYISRNNLPLWRLLRQSNSGPARARDTGISAAIGSHIALLDADDAWLPDKLALTLQHLTRDRLDIVGAHLKSNRAHNTCRLLSPKEMLFFNPYCTSTVIFSRDAYFEVGGFDLSQRYSEDYKLWLTFAWCGKRCGQVSQSQTIYHFDTSTPHRGLSSHLWRMQSNEQANFRWLRKQGLVPLGWCLLARAVSWLKYFRRRLGRY